MKKLKVIYASYSIMPAFTANSIAVANLADKLQNEVDLHVVCYKGNFDENIDDFYGTKIKKLTLLPRIPLKFRAFVLAVYCVLLSIFTSCNIIYSREIMVNLVACILKVPNIFEIHIVQQYWKKYDFRYRQYLNFIKKRKALKQVVCISEALKQECIAFGVSKEILSVCHSGVTEIKTKPYSHANKNNVLYVGSIQKGKGVDIIIKLAKIMPEYNFNIVGGNPGDILETKNLKHTPWVWPAKIHTIYENAQILIVPNQEQAVRFNSPLKLFEYMTTNRAIVSSDIYGVNEILENEINALLVKPGDIDGYKNAIIKLSNDEDLYKKLAENALIKSKEYTYEKRAQNLLRVFEKVIKK